MNRVLREILGPESDEADGFGRFRTLAKGFGDSEHGVHAAGVPEAGFFEYIAVVGSLDENSDVELK